MKGIKLPYLVQNDIWCTCKLYDQKPLRLQQKIDRMILRYGKDYSDALRALLLTENETVAITLQYHVSASQLYKMRKRFYENWRQHIETEN
ncbi:MAG: hypothetical protein WCP73_03220 [Eubacteriales bacterium]